MKIIVTVMIISTPVVKISVSVSNNSSFQDYTHPNIACVADRIVCMKVIEQQSHKGNGEKWYFLTAYATHDGSFSRTLPSRTILPAIAGYS